MVVMVLQGNYKIQQFQKLRIGLTDRTWRYLAIQVVTVIEDMTELSAKMDKMQRK